MTSPYQHRLNRKARLAAEFIALDPEAVRDSLVASFHEVDPDSAKQAIVASFRAGEDREASDRNLELLAWCYNNEESLVASWIAGGDPGPMLDRIKELDTPRRHPSALNADATFVRVQPPQRSVGPRRARIMGAAARERKQLRERLLRGEE